MIDDDKDAENARETTQICSQIDQIQSAPISCFNNQNPQIDVFGA
mgnify:FL=1